jgi:molecular chaperone DnaK
MVSTSSSVSSPGGSLPDGPFGAVADDLSLISSPGTSAPSGEENAFGHVEDLSLVSSTGTGTAAARPAGRGPGNTVALAPATNPASGPGRADLPSVVPKPQTARQPPAQPGYRPDGGMQGRAPPLIAPQPFGPMERMDEGHGQTHTLLQQPPPKPPPLAKTMASPYAAPAPPPPAPHTAPMPLGQTAPLGQVAPGPQIQPFGGAPPQPLPARRPPSAAPPPPPNAHGAQNKAPSQPPIFGSFQSSPPDGPPLELAGAPGAAGQAYAQQIPQAPGPPRGLQYQSPVLVDVTPRALVVETAGGYTDTIIPRNSKIPCERTRRFTTGRDMQTSVRVRVGQGESPSFPQNTYLGAVELSGLRAAPRGTVTVAVTFEVDADGSLRVRARDVQTGQEARVTLQLVGVADESSVVMMINRFAQQPVVGGTTPQ